MKLPQRWKKLIRLIVVTQIVFCFSLMADEQVGVKIFPVKKKDSKILESDISQVVDAVEKSFCNLGFNCLDRGAGMSAMLEEVKLGQQGVLDEAIKLGKNKQAQFALVVTVNRLSSGSYTLTTKLIHLESSQIVPISDAERKPTIDDLFDYAADTLGRVIIENINKFVKVDATRTKEAELKQACDDKGSDYRWVSSSCKLTDVAAARLKQECENDGRIWNETYCSQNRKERQWLALIPGAGQIYKKRTYWGIFWIAATVGAYANYSDKKQIYNDKKEEYRSVVPVPFPVNLGFMGHFIYYDYRYKAFEQAANDASDAANLAFAVYVFQTFWALGLDSSTDYWDLSNLGLEIKKH